MRLRDSALTLEDYSLWKTHELEDVDPTTTCPWPGSGRLLEEALFLVPENMPAGRVNGQRLAARSPLHSEPGAASSTGVVVRCEARHNKPGGDHRRAEDFKHVRQALHLCVGARVMLTQNRLWNVPTVPSGLMNGARGVVVASIYAAPGEGRSWSLAARLGARLQDVLPPLLGGRAVCPGRGRDASSRSAAGLGD